MNKIKIRIPLDVNIVLLSGAIAVTSLTSLDIYRHLSLLLLPFIVLSLVKRMNGKLPGDYIFLLLYSIVYLFLAILNRNYGIGALLNIWFMISFYILIKHVELDEKNMLVLAIIYLFICIKYAISAESYSEIHYENLLFNETLINPNSVSYMVCFFSIFIWIQLISNQYGMRLKKILAILVLVSSMWTIVHLESRSSYIALWFFFITVYVVPRRYLKRHNCILKLYVMIILLSIIVPFIYVHMYQIGYSIDHIGSISKKMYTGREILWQQIPFEIDSFLDILFGLGSKYQIFEATDMHNNTLSIFKNMGIVFLLYIYIYIGYEIKSIFSGKINDKMVFYAIGFLSMLLVGCFESIFLFSPSYLVMMLSLGLCRQVKNKLKES